ncbi:FAD-dependent monooxygenase [Tranquillimonas rosea]|uniref:FAD-dependent monooxygenase n=1 Tax=Tranquillimonas rosea TaxID=641238 RepID=UPI003BAAE025
MTHATVDILVSGAGIAGMVTAAGLARAGFSVCIVDPSVPADSADAAGSDLRSTAYLRPARALFDRLGLWETLAPHATPLEVLRVIDTTGWPPAERERRSFEARDLGHDSFGWNIPNWRTRRELAAILSEMPRVDLRLGTGFSEMLVRDREARVRLDDGTHLTARLVLGADGRASPVRQATGIGVDTTRYGQTALAFAVTHPVPHGNISTEIYNSGGAFTTVPLPDHDGQPASAIVWMDDGPRSAELRAGPAETFAETLRLRSCDILGRMTPVTPIRAWPVITQTAHRMTARRTAILAEAAHVLPPIGAQGLNTSLVDVALLLNLAERHRETLGGDEMLAAFERGRTRDVHARAAVIDLFNRVCKSDRPLAQAARTAGLSAVHGLAPLRRKIMRAGLGDAEVRPDRGGLPR